MCIERGTEPSERSCRTKHVGQIVLDFLLAATSQQSNNGFGRKSVCPDKVVECL